MGTGMGLTACRRGHRTLVWRRHATHAPQRNATRAVPCATCMDRGRDAVLCLLREGPIRKRKLKFCFRLSFVHPNSASSVSRVTHDTHTVRRTHTPALSSLLCRLWPHCSARSAVQCSATRTQRSACALHVALHCCRHSARRPRRTRARRTSTVGPCTVCTCTLPATPKAVVHRSSRLPDLDLAVV